MTLHQAKQQAAKAGKTTVEVQPAFTGTGSIRLVPLADFGKRSQWASKQAWTFTNGSLTAHKRNRLTGQWPCR